MRFHLKNIKNLQSYDDLSLIPTCNRVSSHSLSIGKILTDDLEIKTPT